MFFGPRTARLPDYLLWSMCTEEGIVVHKSGNALQRSARLILPSLNSATPDELAAIRRQMAQPVKLLPEGTALHVHLKQRTVGGYFPVGDFSNSISHYLDEERRQAANTVGEHFETEVIVTLTQFLDKGVAAKAGLFFVRDELAEEHIEKPLANSIQNFRALWQTFFNGIKPIVPAAHELSRGQTLEYLFECVSLRRQKIEVPQEYTVLTGLDERLGVIPITGGLRPIVGDQYVLAVSLNGYPDETAPLIFKALQAIPFEFDVSWRYKTLTRAQAQREVETTRRKYNQKRKSLTTLLIEQLTREQSTLENPDVFQKVEDAELALQLLGDGAVSFGFVTVTAFVAASTLEEVERRAGQLASRLNNAGFIASIDSVNTLDAFFGMHPGNCFANLRAPLLSSINLVDMLLIPMPWSGVSENPHLNGPPLVLARTRDGAPMRFDTHQYSDAGNALAAGSTGMGKSVLLSALRQQFDRYKGSQTFYFDVGGSSRATTLAIGGAYYSFGAKNAPMLQPLRGIDDELERAWAVGWIREMVDRQGVPVTPEREAAISSALKTLAANDAHERTLSLFASFIQDQDVRQALTPFTAGGRAGNIFDGDKEEIADCSHLSFDFENVKENIFRLPLIRYLFHRVEQRLDGRPTMFLVDEAWSVFVDPTFAGIFEVWVRTLRKRNACIILATQTLSDFEESALSHVLIENCPTRFFLPNQRALDPSVSVVYERFGLNAKQIETIATAYPKKEYFFQSTLGSQLFDLNLSPLAIALFGANQPNDHEIMDSLPPSLRGAAFVKAFLEAKGAELPADFPEEVPNA